MVLLTDKQLDQVISAGISDGAKITFLVILRLGLTKASQLVFERSLELHEIKAQLSEISRCEELQLIWKKKTPNRLKAFIEENEEKKNPIKLKMGKSAGDLLSLFVKTFYENFGQRPKVSRADFKGFQKLRFKLGSARVEELIRDFFSLRKVENRAQARDFIRLSFLRIP